jgi:hypothetical protein
MIFVSHNELVVLATKAFQGLRLPFGEADRIANMVADLEMVGFEGVKLYIHALHALKKTQSKPCHILSESSSKIDIDINGNSVVCHLPTILDYVSNKLVEQKQVTLTLHNSVNRWLAFGEICHFPHEQLYINATWYDEVSKRFIQFILELGKALPEVFTYQIDSQTAEQYSQNKQLVINFSRKPFKFPPADKIELHLNAKVLSEQKESIWESGIPLKEEDWNELKQFAKLILVPSNS